MSEFEMDFGEQLIEFIAKRLSDEGVDDSHHNIRLFIRDFSEWSECVLDDEDYVAVENSDTSSSEEEEEPEVRGVVVEEEYETEVDENGFHSLKDCVVKSQN